jgi:hypothetical protein
VMLESRDHHGIGLRHIRQLHLAAATKTPHRTSRARGSNGSEGAEGNEAVAWQIGRELWRSGHASCEAVLRCCWAGELGTRGLPFG